MTIIDRSHCTKQRHGDASAYRQGCRCADARNDHRIYFKRRRHGYPYRRLIDATGTARRIRALYAIGHTSQTIAELAGFSNAVHIQQIARHRTYIQQGTAARVAAVYEQLRHQPGTSHRTAGRAARAGWPTPNDWGDDIDDPTVNPLAPPDPNYVDRVAVDLALAGDDDKALALTDAERAAAVHIGQQRGMAETLLATRLHANNRTIRQLAATTAA